MSEGRLNVAAFILANPGASYILLESVGNKVVTIVLVMFAIQHSSTITQSDLTFSRDFRFLYYDCGYLYIHEPTAELGSDWCTKFLSSTVCSLCDRHTK